MSEETELSVVYAAQELGNGVKTGHWKIKVNGNTVGELPNKNMAIQRAIAQSSSVGVDVIKIVDENGEVEMMEL